MIRVEIDPNVRLSGGRTFVGVEDVPGRVSLGEVVEVYAEDWLSGVATVAEVDGDRGLVYLRVDWGTLRAPWW